jgi:hypothetical protein
MNKKLKVFFNVISVPIIAVLFSISVFFLFNWDFLFDKDSNWRKEVLSGDINLWKEIFFDWLVK